MYSSDLRSLTLIQPTGANSVSVTFNSFDVEDGGTICIYMTGRMFSTHLLEFILEPTAGTVTSNNGHLLFEFRSDCATAEPGWEATWNSQGADNTAPNVE